MEIIEAPSPRGPTRWATYADGQWRLAQLGTDYDDPRKFAEAGRAWAWKHGYKFHTHKVPGGVEFQLVPPAPQEEGSDDANR